MDIWVKLKRSLITLAVICLIASAGYVKRAAKSVSAEPYNIKTVIIDPGHGGFDGGAAADDGTLEKDINLEIALKLCECLRFYGFRCIMTRESDSGTDSNGNTISARKKSDLNNRLKLMDNGNSVYVSIHLNKFTTTAARGIQVFYSPNFKSAEVLGECIQSTVIKHLQPDNKRLIKRGYDSTYLLKNARVPAVIVECGFLSNRADLDNLKESGYQSKMAFLISAGILKYNKLSGQ